MRREGSIRLGLLWISPWLFGFTLFMLIPMAMSLATSFTDEPLIEPALPVGLDNYRQLLADPTFRRAVFNTAVYCIAAIPLSTVISLVIAALLNSRVRAGGFFQACVFLPTLVPTIASAMIWMWLFNGEFGLVNRLLSPIWPAVKFATSWMSADWRAIFDRPPNWLFDRHWAMAAVVIVTLWGVGQAVTIYLAALRQIPEALYEAAELDGMSPSRKFFAVPYVIFQQDKGGPGQSAYFYTHYLYDNAFVYGKMGYASAMAWIQLLIILALTGLMFAFSRKVVYYRSA